MISSLLLSRKEGRCYNPLRSLERRGDGIILSPLSKDEDMITTLLLPRREEYGIIPSPLSKDEEMLSSLLLSRKEREIV
jgi:hypothetical protein